MRMTAVAVAMAGIGGAGIGCGSGDADESEVQCIATASDVLGELAQRTASPLDARGLPIRTWSWHHEELVRSVAYRYDDDGRLVEVQVDGTEALVVDPFQPRDPLPDGRFDVRTEIAYGSATADVSATDLRTQQARRARAYVLDAAGRPARIARFDGLATEVRAFQYDAEGRVLVADERGLGGFPTTRLTEYVYGAGGWPSSMRARVDGQIFDWVFEHEVTPGRVHLHARLLGLFDEDYFYEHDADGRLTRALDPSSERSLAISYAADGGVEVVVDNGFAVHTYSAACGVVFEVPRGLPAPRGPEPEGLYLLPRIPHPYVMPSLVPF